MKTSRVKETCAYNEQQNMWIGPRQVRVFSWATITMAMMLTLPSVMAKMMTDQP